MSYQKCPLCNGSGIDPTVALSSNIPRCPTCKGARIIHTMSGQPPTIVESNGPSELGKKFFEDYAKGLTTKGDE